MHVNPDTGIKVNTIRLLRKKKNWSQADLAEQVGLAQNTVSDHENGKRKIKPADEIAYAKALDISVDRLYSTSMSTAMVDFHTPEPGAVMEDSQQSTVEYSDPHLIDRINDLTISEQRQISQQIDKNLNLSSIIVNGAISSLLNTWHDINISTFLKISRKNSQQIGGDLVTIIEGNEYLPMYQNRQLITIKRGLPKQDEIPSRGLIFQNGSHQYTIVLIPEEFKNGRSAVSYQKWLTKHQSEIFGYFAQPFNLVGTAVLAQSGANWSNEKQ